MHIITLLSLLFLISGALSDLAAFNETVDYPTVGENVLWPTIYQYIRGPLGTPLVSTAIAHVDLSDLDKGSTTTAATRAYARELGGPGYLDDAGHILANRMGGSGKDPVNIFPQNPTVNRGIWRVFEGKIYTCISTYHLTAKLEWRFSYSDTTRPISIVYRVSYSGTECDDDSQTFPN